MRSYDNINSEQRINIRGVQNGIQKILRWTAHIKLGRTDLGAALVVSIKSGTSSLLLPWKFGSNATKKIVSRDPILSRVVRTFFLSNGKIGYLDYEIHINRQCTPEKGAFLYLQVVLHIGKKRVQCKFENLNDGFAREKMNAAPFISCLDKKKS